MNEKIKELAKSVDAVFDVIAMGRHDGVLFTETELERFAELIIQECAKVADIERPTSAGCGYITYTVGERIKQHFGVK